MCNFITVLSSLGDLIICISDCCLYLILRSWCIEEQLEKSHPARTKHAILSKVCLMTSLLSPPFTSRFNVTSSWISGYSGSHGGVVGSVLVTNLKTGTRKGGWERAEVRFSHT